MNMTAAASLPGDDGAKAQSWTSGSIDVVTLVDHASPKALPDGHSFESGARKAKAKRPDRKAAITAAALKLFASTPYEDVSVDDICAEANVAHGLVFYHFGNKRGLLAAAVADAWRQLVESSDDLGPHATVVDRFRGYLHRHFEYFHRYPERFPLMTRSGHANSEVAGILASSRREAMHEIQISLGCPDAAPARLGLALEGWAGFVDAATSMYIESPDITIDQITDMCAQVLVASVRSASDLGVDAATELEAVSRVAATMS